MIIRFFCLLILTISVQLNVTAQRADNLPLRLRVCTYNVGHFNQGSLGGFQGLRGHVQAELLQWKYWIGKQNLDILALNEWNTFFDKDSVYHAEEQLLKPFYKNAYFGKTNKWIYNGIVTNYNLTNIRQVKWDGDYYAILGDLPIGDKVITVISTHIPWQKGKHENSLQALIDELRKYEYFICMGDMNAGDQNQLKFVEAGFNMANGGHLGWFSTAAAAVMKSGRKGEPNTNIDNIVTSPNIKI